MQETHAVMDGLIWPRAKIQQRDAAKTLKACMLPWGAVSEQNYIEVDKWGTYRYKPTTTRGMRKICDRPNGDVGEPPQNPNVWISPDHAGPSITAQGNTRAVPQGTSDGTAWGVRRLTPFECLRANGIKEDLHLAELRQLVVVVGLERRPPETSVATALPSWDVLCLAGLHF